jgi:hypothetical protein
LSPDELMMVSYYANKTAKIADPERLAVDGQWSKTSSLNRRALTDRRRCRKDGADAPKENRGQLFDEA